MRARRTNAIRFILAALAGLCGIASFGASRCAGRGRGAAAARDPVLARSADRCGGGPVRDGGGRRPVQRRRACGHHQYRQRIAGRHRARCRRHQRFRAGRHQRAGAFSRQGQAGRAADQGGVRAVQQGALCHHRPQEPRHPGAVRHRGQESRRRRGRPLDPAVAGGGQAERHQARKRQTEQHQRRGARADAVGGPDRRRHRIFLSVGDQPERSRRAGRRSGGAAIRRLWLRGLRLCNHRQSGSWRPPSRKP